MPARTSSKQLARAAPRSALIQFCFHFDICLRANLDMARPHHHGAVGGFFSAPQERAVSTSFEGGDKSGALPVAVPLHRRIMFWCNDNSDPNHLRFDRFAVRL